MKKGKFSRERLVGFLARFLRGLLFAALLPFWHLPPAFAEPPNLFTYQGRLKEGDQPVTGVRSVGIQLCDALTGGACYSAPGFPQNAQVTNGLFRSVFGVPASVNLQTGNWYIEISVAGAVLSPREQLTSSPYAIYSATASFAGASAGAPPTGAAGGVLSGTYPNPGLAASQSAAVARSPAPMPHTSSFWYARKIRWEKREQATFFLPGGLCGFRGRRAVPHGA